VIMREIVSISSMRFGESGEDLAAGVESEAAAVAFGGRFRNACSVAAVPNVLPSCSRRAANEM
jgi:hypothetical protein